MALDIAPAPSGIAPGAAPPGANPAPPGAPADLFAALLALQVQANTAGPPTAAGAVIEPPHSAKSGKDGKDEPSSEATALLQPAMTINPNIIPPPVQPGGLTFSPAAPTKPNTTITKTTEAMDTLPALVPGLPGNTLQGSELLPQPAKLNTPLALPLNMAAAPAPSPFADWTATLRQAANVASAPQNVTAPGSALQNGIAPGVAPQNIIFSAAPQNVIMAADPKSVMTTGKLDLQMPGEPANNTGTAVMTAVNGATGKPSGSGAKTKASLATVAQGVLPQVARAAKDVLAGQAIDEVNDKGSRTPIVLPFGQPVPVSLETKATDASPAAAPLTPDDRTALIQQVSDAVQTVRVQAGANGQGHMTVQLHPHDWGKLEVSVTMTPTGGADGGTNVTAHLVADNHAVRAALEDQTSDLRQALSNAGMKLEHLTVSVRSVEAGSEAQTANSDPRSGQQPGSNVWTPQPQPSGGSAPGSESFAGFAGSQGFYAPPGAQWTTEDDAADPEPVIRAASAMTQGIDVRA